MIAIESVPWKTSVAVLSVGLTLMAMACGGGVSEERVKELEEKIVGLEEKIRELEGAASQATPSPDEIAMDSGDGSMGTAVVQEIGLIENYAATRFFPRWMVVQKDIPVKIYLTRLHREHVNQFSIEPFYRSSEVILPGEIGVIEFVPDQVGEFKIRNVGHGFDATLVVVESREEARQLIAGRDIQMYSLIHSVDDFQIFPHKLVLQHGVPTRVHNISLIAEHRVSMEPFVTPEDINVMPREISIVEFTPDMAGQFTIRHEIHGFTGELIVEDSG